MKKQNIFLNLKMTIVFLAIAVLILSLSSCSMKRVGKCENCGQKETLTEYILGSLSSSAFIFENKDGTRKQAGDKVYVCADCRRELKFYDN